MTDIEREIDYLCDLVFIAAERPAKYVGLYDWQLRWAAEQADLVIALRTRVGALACLA